LEANVAEVPLYDPDKHTEDDEVVKVEMWCKCTAAHRQVDPLRHVKPMVEDWVQRHSGDGHGPLAPAEAAKERNARREAALRAIGEQDRFKAKTYDAAKGPGWDWSGLGGKKKKG
jgi:hypothetical protein